MNSQSSKTFTCHHSMSKKKLKGEDVAFHVENMSVVANDWSLYCVCDGHGGTAAAMFVQDNIADMLRKQLPSEAQPSNLRSKEGKRWAHKVSEAIAVVFCSVDEAFAQTSMTSGTTVTLALVCGSLLTVANVGDSEAFLDTFYDTIPMTECHKVDTSLSEQNRLKENSVTIGAFLSTVGEGSTSVQRAMGPLRVWPGGIAISRSVGDFECSSHVIASPSITQLVLPDTGARLIMASDGLWDHVGGRRACRATRHCILSRAPSRLFRVLMNKTSNCLVDDTTILIVDVLLTHGTHADFSIFCRKERSEKSPLQSLRKLVYRLPGLRRKPTRFFAQLDTETSFPSIKSKGHAIYREAPSALLVSSMQEQEIPIPPHLAMCNEKTNRWNPDESNEQLQRMQLPKHLSSVQYVSSQVSFS